MPRRHDHRNVPPLQCVIRDRDNVRAGFAAVDCPGLLWTALAAGASLEIMRRPHWLDHIAMFLRHRRTEPRPDDSGDQSFDPENPFPEPVVIKFGDVLDLHSIPPRQVKAVVEDFLADARSRRVRWVRIIHGKGIGVQREMVRSILSRASFVADYSDAPPAAGGVGATLATLKFD